MANIFKTTLKKDIIADIANNNIREIRFPITKFWATRLTDEYNLDERVFNFKTFDTLELSSPSNKETDGEIYSFEFVKTFVDGDEFVVEFETIKNEVVEMNEEVQEDVVETPDVTPDVDAVETPNTENEDTQTCEDDVMEYETPQVSNVNTYDLLNDLFESDKVFDNLYSYENVYSTNARQVIVLPNGRILGSKRTLPINNDVEVRIEFDMNEKIYFDSISDLDVFEERVLRTLAEIRKNNFVFIWKRHTGIFKDNKGRVYFGIKYSTRKSIGFNRRYNVQ